MWIASILSVSLLVSAIRHGEKLNYTIAVTAIVFCTTCIFRSYIKNDAFRLVENILYILEKMFLLLFAILAHKVIKKVGMRK